MDRDHSGLPGLLTQGLKAMGQELDAVQQGLLLDYVGLLVKWNKVYNLTSVRDPAAMVVRHLLDSLAILPLVTAGRLLDVGSGAGLPAVPLAIARPDLRVTSLDSNHKKTRFVTHVKLELALGNLEVVHTRIEDLDRPGAYDQVVSRAFTELGGFVAVAGPWCRPAGQLLAMKGRPERDAGIKPATGWRIREVRELKVPGLEAQRSVVVLAAAG